ncbi:MAG: hypothetical protein PHV23_01025 [Candidatus Gracilibacteria bacterium]|nr:hypothetical protein [Candidatus Gracilibacteria bacterium]
MGFILGILQSFLNATGMVLGKIVLENKKIGNNLQTLFNRSYHFFIIIILFYIGIFHFELNKIDFTYKEYLIIIIATAGLYITYPLRRIAYASEKVSVLQPFAMLFQVFPIIIGFIFIASEKANFITFISALVASFIVILPNIKINSLKINKYCLMVLTSSIIKSFQVFSTIYFLTKLNSANFYLLESILVIIFSIILMLYKSEFGEFKKLEKSYVKLMMFVNSIVIVSILLALTMYSTLGIVTTSLLSLLYLIFVYIIGFFVLKEIPSKKDIVITVLVSLCIMIGMYFKN